jgi:hypothetical protein
MIGNLILICDIDLAVDRSKGMIFMSTPSLKRDELYKAYAKQEEEHFKRKVLLKLDYELTDSGDKDKHICGLCGENLSDNPLIPHKCINNGKDTFRVCENCHFKATKGNKNG